MKKIILNIAIVGVIAGIVIGGTIAYFADTETSENDMGAGTFDIDDEGTWTKNYTMSNVYPGKDAEEINFDLRNKGSLPMKVWMIIKDISHEENGITDSEQDWYDANGGPKNDLDQALTYGLKVNGNTAVELDAEITLENIKDYYINLVKTDQPFNPGDGDGILYPDDTISIEQKLYLPTETENWAQSDVINFKVEILAQQIDVQEPENQLSYIQNKKTGGDWAVVEDERAGVLKYKSYGNEFSYDFLGRGLENQKEYCLIYAKDPWGASKPLIGSGMSNDTGEVVLVGSKDLGNLPYPSDENYPDGAKVWLLPCNEYSGTIGWPPSDDWLFDAWPGLIRYEKNSGSGLTQTETVQFADLGTDPQFGTLYDYNTADVSFTYDTPTDDQLTGTIEASNLQPHTTYQVKFIGKPTCEYPSEGNNDTNEYIGYKGRWTCLDCSCSGSGCNRSDSQYESNSHHKGDSSECIGGYIVWDFFTTDSDGDATKVVITDNSYHVLRCNGGTCGVNNDSLLQNSDCSGTSPNYPYCVAGNVEGELERPGSIPCGGLTLGEGDYELELVLTEECFHSSCAGTWTAVMSTDIDFEIE